MRSRWKAIIGVLIVGLGIGMLIVSLRLVAALDDSESVFVETWMVRLGLQAPIPDTLTGFRRGRPYCAEDFRRLREAVDEQAARGESLLPLYDTDAAYFDPGRLKLKPTDVVADIGCGTGAAEVAALDRKVPFASWFLVELHRPTAEFALYAIRKTDPEAAGRFEIKINKDFGIGLSNRSVDVLFMINVKLASPRYRDDEGPSGEELKKMMDSLHNVLKPKARVHLFEPVRDERRDPYPLKLLIRNYLKSGFVLVKHEEIEMGERMHHVVLAEALSDAQGAPPLQVE